MTEKEKDILLKQAVVFVVKEGKKPVTIQRRIQNDGKHLWGIFWKEYSLSNDGEWIPEPLFGKSKEFIKKNRFKTSLSAVKFLKTKKGKIALECQTS